MTAPTGGARVLETVLTGRNLLSPVLSSAARDVVQFNTAVGAANDKAATAASTSASRQEAAAAKIAAANSKASSSAVASSKAQTDATDRLIAANSRLDSSVAGSSATYQRSAASLREKLGLQALDADAADRSAAANSRAAASAAVFSKAIDSGTLSLDRQTSATLLGTRSTSANTAERERNTLAAKAQEAASRSLEGANSLLGTSLTPVTAGLSAVGLGLAYAAYKGMDFDKSMSQVQAATQASSGTMKELRQAAIQAGADTQYSAGEAASGITELAKAGVSTADILGGGLKGALSLAAAGQIDVGEAAETAATALTVFNLKGDQVNHVADLLAAGAGKAQGSVGDLSQAMNQSALVAAQMGLSVDDTVGALAEFASNGLTGSDAGTSFKTMLQRLNPQSEQAAKLMDELGLSAYDSQGKFVGLQTYAEKLHTALGGMSEEQRNATLNTLYGSDAIRAASILYKDGAAGVADWAGKVNDAGYAAKQAAQLQDNLSGDLEKLGGSVDTFFTTLGNGAQGPLREVVQGLTALVNLGGDVIGFWNGLPGPIQAGVLALGAFVLLRGPLDTLFSRAAVGLTGMVTQMGMATGATSGLTLATGAAKSALGGLMAASGPLLAVAGITFAISQLIQLSHAGDDARKTVEEMSRSIERSDTNKDAFSATSSSIQSLRDKITDLKPFVSSWSEENRSWFERSFIPVTAGVEDARQSLSTYQDKLADLEAAQKRQGDTVATLASQYHVSKDDVIAFADAHGINLADGLAKTQGRFTELADASIASGDAMVNGKDAAADFQDQLQGTSDAASNASKQIDLLKTSLDMLTGAHVSLQQAQAAVYDATDAATGAMQANKGAVTDASGALNLHTENGRKAQDVLVGIADKSNQLIATMEQQGATTDQVKAKDAELRDGFVKSATQMGISKKAAEDLANQIYGIPDQRNTRITADTKQATDAVAAAQAAIDNMRGRTLTVSLQTVDLGNGTSQQSYQTASGNRALGAKYNAAGGILGSSMSGGVAEIVPPNTMRVIGDRMADDEAYIPINGSSRSKAILGQTAARMGFGLTAEARHLADGGLLSVGVNVDGRQAAAAFDSYAAAAGKSAQQKLVGSFGAGGSGGYRDLGRQIAASMGLASQFGAIDYVFTRESGWNNLAQNPTSTAFGIPQFLDSTWASVGGHKTTDPSLQIQYGLKYMNKYGGPNGAAAFWQAHHWYDDGGLASGPGYLPKATPEPERVLSPAQTRAFEEWMTSPAASPGYGMGSAGQGSAPLVVSLTDATLTGRFEIGPDGLATLVDGRITQVQAQTLQATRRTANYGTRR